MTLSNILLAFAVVATALMAGLFYSYSCSVIPGLAKLNDAGYLSAMQSINRAIQNPAFFSAFFGALLLLPLAAWANYGVPVTPRFWWLVAGTMAYGIGLFGITVLCNVPLNNLLDGFEINSATPQQLAEMRLRFEQPWNFWNVVRTIAVILALVCSVIACLLPVKLPK